MKVSEAMNRGAHTVKAQDTLKSAANLMAEKDIGFLPVEENDRLVGMITDRDIVVRCVAHGKNGDTLVRDAMTGDVKYCFEDEELDDAIKSLAQQQVRRMPVMSRDKRLVGILSLADAALRYSADSTGLAFSGVVKPGGKHADKRS
jgi:CBS domain-containing protein